MQPIRISPATTCNSQKAIRTCIETALDTHPACSDLLKDTEKASLIVVKPNWVQEWHEYRKDVWEPVITNPALLLCLLECLAERIAGTATICVCDGPHTYANFGAILQRGDFQARFEKSGSGRRKWSLNGWSMPRIPVAMCGQIWERTACFTATPVRDISTGPITMPPWSTATIRAQSRNTCLPARPWPATSSSMCPR